MIRPSTAKHLASTTNERADGAHPFRYASYLFDFMDRPGKFLNSGRKVLAARGTKFFVSAVSIWEMRLTYSSRHPPGGRKSRFSPEDVIDALEDQDVKFPLMTMLHAARRLRVPLDNKDPLNELLFVQVQEAGERSQAADRGQATCRPPARGRRVRAWVKSMSASSAVSEKSCQRRHEVTTS